MQTRIHPSEKCKKTPIKEKEKVSDFSDLRFLKCSFPEFHFSGTFHVSVNPLKE